jgi:colanic acid biosynthesis glycosyl transferase WcaI
LKILIISQYYYPENFIINDFVKSLKNKGNYIEVLTGLPNYPGGKFYNGYNLFNKNKEIVDDIIIHRSRLFPRSNSGKFSISLNYISFVIFGTLKLFSIKGDFEKIFVFAPSPITVGIVGIFAAKKFNAKCFIWVQDLWPESVKVAGNINNRFILEIINKLTKKIYKYYDLIFVQSEAFINYIVNQNINKKKIKYLPNFADDFYLIKKKPNIKYDKFSITFAGNIGKAQNLEILIEVAKILKKKSEKIIFIIIGSGRNSKFLTQKINQNDVTEYFDFLGRKSPETMPNYFSSSDVMLISLKKSNIFSLTIPSKLQSYMAYGVPILGSIDGISNQIINESNSGFASSADDVDGLVENILKMKNLSNYQLNKMASNSKKYYVNHFSKEIVISSVTKFMNE